MNDEYEMCPACIGVGEKDYPEVGPDGRTIMNRKQCGNCFGAGKVKKKKGTSTCFITIATLIALNTTNNGAELTSFRNFRDTHMLKQNIEEVQRYYALSPIIVKGIGQREDAVSVYKSLWENSLSKAYALINDGKTDEAIKIYKETLRNLETEFVEKKS